MSGEPLAPGGKLISGKNKNVTDGPYTEGKEVVGGFFIISAANMDEAVEISKDCPDFDKGGSVQVRHVMKM
ncbi:MAG: YciI family protein [Bacteroidota bacterium]